ncbi:MAG TPA: hypothetical protein VKG84_01100, partial [Candidatus Acidoferrales bacterium]|nr:hypothetical protein [Candidatus Acidoferrales bacterium]
MIFQRRPQNASVLICLACDGNGAFHRKAGWIRHPKVQFTAIGLAEGQPGKEEEQKSKLSHEGRIRRPGRAFPWKYTEKLRPVFR